MWALQAKARYNRRLYDQLNLLNFEFMGKHDGTAFAQKLAMLASGPGQQVRWEETISPHILAAIERCERRADEAAARRLAKRKAELEAEPAKPRTKRKRAGPSSIAQALLKEGG